MHWIEKTAKPTEIDGEQRYPEKMALLCWGKAEFFLSELKALTDLGVWQSFLLRVDASMRFALSECILLVTLQHHADFNRRVVIMIRSAPYNLFFIAKREKDIKCPERLCLQGALEHSRREATRDGQEAEIRLQGPARVL